MFAPLRRRRDTIKIETNIGVVWSDFREGKYSSRFSPTLLLLSFAMTAMTWTVPLTNHFPSILRPKARCHHINWETIFCSSRSNQDEAISSIMSCFPCFCSSHPRMPATAFHSSLTPCFIAHRQLESRTRRLETSLSKWNNISDRLSSISCLLLIYSNSLFENLTQIHVFPKLHCLFYLEIFPIFFATCVLASVYYKACPSSTQKLTLDQRRYLKLDSDIIPTLFSLGMLVLKIFGLFEAIKHAVFYSLLRLLLISGFPLLSFIYDLYIDLYYYRITDFSRLFTTIW